MSMMLNIAWEVVEILETRGFRARLAGGCVRDRLLGLQPKDYDVATDALPKQVLESFSNTAFKSVPTGIEHGTVTLAKAGVGIEVTTLREDVSTDGRRATVRFGSSFEKDAERRDFTINAMFEDRQGQIYDFFGGQEDIQKGRLVFVGDASQRIREDYLRILRLFRFWSRYGFEVEDATLEACQRLKGGLERVSQERVTQEWLRILSGPHATKVVASMATRELVYLGHGIGKGIADLRPLPQISSTNTEQALFALAFLLLHSGEKEQQLRDLENLRLSRAQLTFIKAGLDGYRLLSKDWQDQAEALLALRHLESHSGEGCLRQWTHVWCAYKLNQVQQLRLEQWQVWEQNLGCLVRSNMPIKAADLQALHPELQGRTLGEALKCLETAYLNQLWHTKEEGLKHYKSQSLS